VNTYLGVDVKIDETDNSIKISQPFLINRIIETITKK